MHFWAHGTTGINSYIRWGGHVAQYRHLGAELRKLPIAGDFNQWDKVGKHWGKWKITDQREAG